MNVVKTLFSSCFFFQEKSLIWLTLKLFFCVMTTSDFFQVQFIFLLKGRQTPLSNIKSLKVTKKRYRVLISKKILFSDYPAE